MEDYSNIDGQSDTGAMMMANLARLPISDKLVLLQTWGLFTDNFFDETVKSILPTLIAKWGVAGEEKYAEVKLRSLREALKKLWVNAQKGETFQILLDFETFEKLLYQSNTEYRGHYVHQFDVFLIGYYILKKLLQSNKPIVDKYKTSNNPNLTWMLAATFHDMGYPIEKIDSWLSAFLKTFLKVDIIYPIEIERIITPAFYDYLKFLSEEHYSLTIEPIAPSAQSPVRDWEFHSILQTNLKKKDHGVIGSLLLIHSLFTKEKALRSRNWFLNVFPRDVLPACHAIALHSLDLQSIGGIRLAKCPYAFLLRLCDAIQDWQRSLGARDYSELTALNIDFSGDVPLLTCSLSINEKAQRKKFKELDELVKNLKTDDLLRVEIKQTNGDRVWILD